MVVGIEDKNNSQLIFFSAQGPWVKAWFQENWYMSTTILTLH